MNNFSESCVELVTNLRKIEAELNLDKRMSAEDQLKVPISNFLTKLGEYRSASVNVFTEHRQGESDLVQGVRLDMAIKNGRGQLTGHIELKAPAKSANPYRQSGWSKHDKDQWKRLSNHPNLVYTNGWEWTLLRHGLDRPIAHLVLTPQADGSISKNQAEELSTLFDQFLSWKPTTPSSPRGLANTLAPLTRFLRDTVIEIVTDNHPDALDKLYKSWSADLMPGATEAQFADSFAQTFAYALLLARVESDVPPADFSTSVVTPELRSNGHRLIGSVLELMAQPANRALVDGPVSLLEATIGAIDVEKFTNNSDPWLYFYEDFLASYDPKMRADAGVYYTPVEIVEAQVRLLDEVLRTRFGRTQGLGDVNTNILDNAAGTATYPLAVARHVIEGSPSPQDAARSLAKRLFAFELLMGPYSVAHMRLTQLLESTGIQLGNDGVQVYLTNSLTDPGTVSADYQQISLWEVMEDINEETRKAGLVKNSHTPIRVILGNPPYDRGSRKKAIGAGSIKYKNVVLEKLNGSSPLLEDFIEPLKNLGQGGQAKNLYNSYVYFIRWAIWKACEQNRTETGIVSYITASSYLRGPGYAGMREYMRKVFDEIWIIDLGGEGRGAVKDENVFAIQTPVAIFVGIQHPTTASGTPKKHADRVRQKATVYYQRIDGNRSEKLGAMSRIQAPNPDNHTGWEKLPPEGWTDKFVPSSVATLSDGLPLNDIFPWSVSGAQFKRKWPIAALPEILEQRWDRLFESGTADPTLFSEDRDCTVDSKKKDLFTGQPIAALSGEHAQGTMTSPRRYGFRSFDRQWCLPDNRVGTYLRQNLWDSFSSHQLYLVSLTSSSLGAGPVLTVCPYVPDMHFFNNRGAKDVFPLFRTNTKQSPNVSRALLEKLSQTYGYDVSAVEVANYVVGLLGTSAYYAQFEEELAESPAYVVFTVSSQLFQKVAKFGREIVFEQTWGERGSELNAFGQPSKKRFRGNATLGAPTPEVEYPDTWSYDPETYQLRVGKGRFEHVSPAVMEFEVSGMNIIHSWLGYRMKKPAGKSSSALDQIQYPTWRYDTELLELLWQIEFMINAETEGRDLLHAVLSGEKISPSEFSSPQDIERKAPLKKKPNIMF